MHPIAGVVIFPGHFPPSPRAQFSVSVCLLALICHHHQQQQHWWLRLSLCDKLPVSRTAFWVLVFACTKNLCMCGERYSTGSFGSTETEGMVLKRKSRANKQKKNCSCVCFLCERGVGGVCVTSRVVRLADLRGFRREFLLARSGGGFDNIVCLPFALETK